MRFKVFEVDEADWVGWGRPPVGDHYLEGTLKRLVLLNERGVACGFGILGLGPDGAFLWSVEVNEHASAHGAAMIFKHALDAAAEYGCPQLSMEWFADHSSDDTLRLLALTRARISAITISVDIS